MKATLWLLLTALAASVPAAEMTKTNAPAEATNAPAAKKSELAVIPDATHKPVITTNTINVSGKRVTYQAETGMLPILKPDGTSRASVFYVAYTRLQPEDRSQKMENRNPASDLGTRASDRPVTFCFNGGPGSSS